MYFLYGLYRLEVYRSMTDKIIYADIQTINSVEDIEPIVKDIIVQYCSKYGFDEYSIPHTVWMDVLTEIYLDLFKPCKKLLKKDSLIHNEYDLNKVEYVYNYIYKRICNNHSKIVSISGFCEMTGIDPYTVRLWESNRLSTQRSLLGQKIDRDEENSLLGAMMDNKGSPVPYLARLNKKFEYNMPGVRAAAQEKQLLSADDLPVLNAPKQAELSDNLLANGLHNAD